MCTKRAERASERAGGMALSLIYTRGDFLVRFAFKFVRKLRRVNEEIACVWECDFGAKILKNFKFFAANWNRVRKNIVQCK